MFSEFLPLALKFRRLSLVTFAGRSPERFRSLDLLPILQWDCWQHAYAYASSVEEPSWHAVNPGMQGLRGEHELLERY